jgi:hypothetical protein
MDQHFIHWEWLIWGLIKFLKIFGIIPGAMAAFGAKKLYQKWRQNKAMSGWPAVDGTVQSGEVHKKGWRSFWAEITYTYYVGEYRLGRYVRHFRRAENADEFVRQMKDKRVRVHYSDSNPDKSVILDRDLEMIAMLAPQYR